MCGIFGFVTTSGRGPDVALLRRIATITQRRGDHAFGLATLGLGGAMRTFKRPGPATSNLADLDRCRNAAIVLGHCRWATHGSADDNRNNHPHAAGRGWLVHNGVVVNHNELARRYELDPRTECDSEVLGLLMARFPGPLLRRATLTARSAEGRLAMLGLWANPARLLIVRDGNPLHLGDSKAGLYFASLPEGLPGDVVAIDDASAHVLTYAGGAIEHVRADLAA